MEDNKIKHYLDILEAQLAMDEFDFPSHVPVFGPFIRVLRKAWNSVSTRWYVQHYVQQQAAFNAAVLQTLRTLCECQELSAPSPVAREILAQVEHLAEINQRQVKALKAFLLETDSSHGV